MTISLRERFALWWVAIEAQGESDIVYDQLESFYEAKDRHYHTLSYHIAGALELFDECKEYLEEPLLVEGVLFFHDMYDSEAESAHFALEILQHAGVEKEFCKRISDAILVTDHKTEPTTLDQKYLCDIDLSFLALPDKEFQQNTANLRKEFPKSSDEEFRKQVIKFFAPLLARENIFFTETFKPANKHAKENMLAYIANW